jgi:hypothetical protein
MDDTHHLFGKHRWRARHGCWRLKTSQELAWFEARFWMDPCVSQGCWHSVLTYFNRHAPIGGRKRKDALDELPHRPTAFSLYEIAHPWRTRRLLQRLLCGLPSW